jgi:hypothetical protein
MTPMALQSIQQHEFEADKATLFSSVMNVFQDLGYTISAADINTGFITAESATVAKTNFWEAMGGINAMGSTKATAFVESLPNHKSRVRLNFVSTKQQSFGYGRNNRIDRPITDPKAYQIAFERIDEALFVRKSTDSPSPPTAPVNQIPPPSTPSTGDATPISHPK